jgi:hypothetical protein
VITTEAMDTLIPIVASVFVEVEQVIVHTSASHIIKLCNGYCS